MKIRKFSEAADAGKEFEEFADAREAGAEKIANKAHEKGGPALLTWHHFKVKLPTSFRWKRKVKSCYS